MAPAEVVLIYPYFLTQGPEHLLFPPLGMAGLASQLAREGVTVQLVDCTFRTPPEVIAQVADAQPRLIGIYLMATLAHHALALRQALGPLLPQTVWVAGGPLASVYPERYLDCFDLVFVGEADCSFPAFCRDYLTGKISLPGPKTGPKVPGAASPAESLPYPDLPYPGLAWREEGQLRQNPPTHLPAATLDARPVPDRSH